MAYVLITGATGYLGRALTVRLLARGHRVRALVREQSAGRMPAEVEEFTGDALKKAPVMTALQGCDTLVHLVGTPHPAPWKGRQFEAVDGASLRASAHAAREVGDIHMVYVSVAHPAPTMRAYVRVRTEGEAEVARLGLRATILRPWYVLGPGHWWPLALKPLYWLAERIPVSRETALRLGLVWREEMLAALVGAVERPEAGIRIVEVPEIRRAARRECPE